LTSWRDCSAAVPVISKLPGDGSGASILGYAADRSGLRRDIHFKTQALTWSKELSTR
jgi:hypothetical protein